LLSKNNLLKKLRRRSFKETDGLLTLTKIRNRSNFKRKNSFLAGKMMLNPRNLDLTSLNLILITKRNLMHIK